MNRKLILIANDGGDGDYLPGVPIDMENYRKFFTSAEGGAWDEEDEIHEMIDFSAATLLHDYIMMQSDLESVDYWLIVFCGHGYLNANNDTVLCMSDGSEVKVSDLKTWVQYTPCTLIVDCCREKEDIDDAQLIEEALFSDIVVELDENSCRETYNKTLDVLPSGSFYEAYSTRIGERAGDTDTLGGVYSYYLLKCAEEKKRQLAVEYLGNGGSIASLAEVQNEAKPKVIRMRNGKQHPCNSDNIDRIPFVVVT